MMTKSSTAFARQACCDILLSPEGLPDITPSTVLLIYYTTGLRFASNCSFVFHNYYYRLLLEIARPAKRNIGLSAQFYMYRYTLHTLVYTSTNYAAGNYFLNGSSENSRAEQGYPISNFSNTSGCITPSLPIRESAPP